MRNRDSKDTAIANRINQMIPRKPHHKGLQRVRLDRRRRLGKGLKGGKKTKANQAANRILAKTFTGHQFCEGRFNENCTGGNFLSWSHNAKRRKQPDLLHAALLCTNCHQHIEVKPPEEMARIVDEIVASRGDRECEAA